MRCIVTGAAGFVGSSLCDRLLEQGDEVAGIDCFIPYYARELKENNLARARSNNRFQFMEQDICTVFEGGSTAGELLDGVDVVFHQAAQAGVRASWGKDFEIYTHNNVLGTQKLLEACRTRPGIKVVYASSSSVYGETERFPMSEADPTAPVSPYGVSKLAAEHLARLYTHNFGVHTVSLRYFTVYGPRQRPDMAFHRIIKSILKNEEFHLFGSGEQTRDFTFIGDIVQANIDAAQRGTAGGFYNLGGGTRISMNDVIALIEKVTGKRAKVQREARQHGDVSNTGADVSRAKASFGFQPKVGLEEGLRREAEFIESVVLPLGL
ncbi:MAG: GDP-mannose 4,6-dehydratase [Candidatus Sumerlaeaceae bacterium]